MMKIVRQRSIKDIQEGPQYVSNKHTEIESNYAAETADENISFAVGEVSDSLKIQKICVLNFQKNYKLDGI